QRANESASRAAVGASDRWLRAADNQAFIDVELEGKPPRAGDVAELQKAGAVLNLAPPKTRTMPEWRNAAGRVERERAKTEGRWLAAQGFDDTPTPELLKARKEAREAAGKAALATAEA